MFSVQHIPEYERDLERLSNYRSLGVGETLGKLLSGIFNVEVPMWVPGVVETLLWIAVAGIVLWIIYKELVLKPARYSGADDGEYKSDMAFQGTAKDADIRGHEFDKELSRALANEDYALAVNLRYLMALQMLDERGRFTWKEHKTPLMYIAELQQGRGELEQLTRMFLYIKYGHYAATRDVYDEAVALYDTLEKGGEGDGE